MRRDSSTGDTVWTVAALGLVLPWMVLALLGHAGLGVHLDPIPEVLLSGLSIVGAAFLLSWAAEVSQLEIPRSLAIVFLALVAVLPEYGVDLYYAWGAGQALPSWTPGAPHPEAFGLPMANMTGANRLLIGMGWTMVVLIFWWRTRALELDLGPTAGLDYTFLLLATAYAFTIPLKGTLTLVDGLVFVGMFLMYARRAMRHPVEDVHLEGPAAMVGLLPRMHRRVVNVGMFLFAGAAIFLAAEPFAAGLVSIGKAFRIDTFLLVQWLAPLASESPEFIVAALFALRGQANVGLGALISSKVNQWTLLVGMIPMAVAVASGGHFSLPLDDRQREELFLTAAQSLFAVSILANLRMNTWEAFTMLTLFVTQLLMPATEARIAFSWLYVGLALLILPLRRGYWREMLRTVRQNLFS